MQRFLEIANLPTDTQEQRLSKENLMLMTSHFTVVGLVWGTVFLTNGLWEVSCIPFSYTVLSSCSILMLLMTKNFTLFRNIQLCLVLLLPFLIHLVLGGFIQSSVVVLWSIICPMAALFFITIRHSTYWFGAYLMVILAGYLLDDRLSLYSEAAIPDSFGETMYLMNIAGVSVLIFLVQVYFARNERALKEEVRQANKALSKQHEVLTIEQGKTKQILQKIENLFGQQVSTEVAQELIAQESDFEAQSYEVTVLFLDIRNFSKFADNKDPAVVAAFQNIIFGELLAIIRAHRGITNQILGDGIMAVFGAPVQSTTHISDAVGAGYALVDKMKELSDSKRIPPTAVGIGLHTGHVVAGNIGNKMRKQYSLTGSTVNIAARIESLNKKYNSQFLVSEAIQQGIRHMGHRTTFLEEVTLKGIENAMKIYRLL